MPPRTAAAPSRLPPSRSGPPPRVPVGSGKSSVVAFSLLVLTGWTGGHRFYLGRPWTGTAMAALSLLPFLALVPIVTDPAGWMSDGGWLDDLMLAPSVAVMAWCLVDAFLIRDWVRRYEAEAEAEATFGTGRR